MNIFGYCFFASFLISPIPGLMMTGVQRIFNLPRNLAEMKVGIFKLLIQRLCQKPCVRSKMNFDIFQSLSVLIFLVVGFATGVSFQMCLKGSVINAVAVVIEFTFLRTFHVITRSLVSLFYTFLKMYLTYSFIDVGRKNAVKSEEASHLQTERQNRQNISRR